MTNKIIVIKYGGHAMVNQQLKRSFAENILQLRSEGFYTVIVHGGGMQIDHMLKRLNISSVFHQGHRYTDQQTMNVVQMVLAGKINKEITTLICQAGGQALGLTGQDAHFIQATPINHPTFNLTKSRHYVGEVMHINANFLYQLLTLNIIPVIAPIAPDATGTAYNINADLVAGHIAAALKAKKLILLTNQPGVLDKNQQLIPFITTEEIDQYIANGTIHSGMLPKIYSALTALKNDVPSVIIADGRIKNIILSVLGTSKNSTHICNKSSHL